MDVCQHSMWHMRCEVKGLYCTVKGGACLPRKTEKSSYAFSSPHMQNVPRAMPAGMFHYCKCRGIRCDVVTPLMPADTYALADEHESTSNCVYSLIRWERQDEPTEMMHRHSDSTLLITSIICLAGHACG